MTKILRLIVAASVASVILSGFAAAQTPPARTVRAVRIAQPLNIDGRLEEPLYRETPPFNGFVQIEPDEGNPATENTDVWIAYDNTNFYVVFRNWESRPDLVVAKEMRRDHNSTWNGDDIVAFFIDTFQDRRNGYLFHVNQIGGRSEAQTANERQWIGDWNTVWDFAVGKFEGGWVAEMAVPFKSLRYRSGDVQTWGFNAMRTNRWKNELSMLSPTPRARGQQGVFQASRAATLEGLSVPPLATNLEVKPYVISNASGRRTAASALDNVVKGDIGVDAKYGVTQNMTLDLTFNTDFAQVEADQQQVNLTRFSLFFPEKREFFLENQGTFAFGSAGGQNTGGDTPVFFYSRRIGLDAGQVVPIIGGGRLTGRVGRFSFGAVNIQTDDEQIAQTPSTNFSVVRVRRDILRRSSVGLLFTGREPRGDSVRNTAVGVDGTFGFYQNLNINTYWARTDTPGLSGKDQSYRAQLDYGGDRYGVQLERLVIGDNFNPGVGFVRRDDMKKSYAQLRFSPRPANDDVVRRYSFSGSTGYIENGAGRLETRDRDAEFEVQFQSADTFNVSYSGSYEFLPTPFRIATTRTGNITLPVGGYHFNNYAVGYNFATRRRMSGNLSFSDGTFYNGHRTTFGIGGGRVSIIPQISVEPSYSLNEVDLVQGSFTTHLLASRFTYTPTPRMFFSAFLQYNSSNHGLASNVRLRWEYRPGSELFIVYNEDRDTFGRAFPDLSNRAFIVKINRLLRF